MSLKAILVHVDAGCESRVRLAYHLARRHEATVIGIAAGMWEVPAAAMAGPDTVALSVDVIESIRTQVEADLAAARKLFDTVGKDGTVKTEWRSALAFPREAICEAASAADLVIVGSLTSTSSISDYHGANPGEVLLGAGRPVLVVPDGIAAVEAGNVVVAWKNTREARRALADGLPFMKAAAVVTLVQVREADQDAAPLADADSFLRRHGVNVQRRTVETHVHSVDEELVRVARETGADLIIAGGYGSSRLREWIFGGVTRGLLKQDAVACLLSH